MRNYRLPSFLSGIATEGLSGLGSLGDPSPSVVQLVENNESSIDEIIKKLEREFKSEKDVFTFEDNDLIYNKGITRAEKQAWVYYKRFVEKVPMLMWEDYFIDEKDTDSLDKLVLDGAMFYSNGDYLPYPAYTFSNIYERLEQLEQDRDYIVATYNLETYQKHKEALEQVAPDMLRVDHSDKTQRLFIKPIHPIARMFKVKELKPEYMGVDNAEMVNGRGNKLSKKARIELNLGADKYYSLDEVFAKWLYGINFRKWSQISSPFDVVNYYMRNGKIPSKDSDGNPIPKSIRDRIRQDATDAGNNLFMEFINECLTPEDVRKLNYAYNKQFNGWSDINYNKVPLGIKTSSTFLGGGFAIRPEKREAISFMGVTGSGILAYDVGVGKTISALLEVASAIQTGKAKRAIIVVPNPTYPNWIKEAFGGTDPESGDSFNGILSNTGIQFKDWSNMGAKVLPKIESELDSPLPEKTIVFLTHEGFRKLGLSRSVSDDLIAELDEIYEQNNDSAASDVQSQVSMGKKNARNQAKKQESIKSTIGWVNAETEADLDTLGIDYIVIDEAHRCKGVFTRVKADEDGKSSYDITGTQSAIGIKAFALCNYIQRTYGKNVLLLTATPFTNSPLEVYSMISLVGYQTLVDYNVYNLNDFFDQFVNPEMEFVIKQDGSLKSQQVIKQWVNKVVLQKIVFTKILYKSGEDIGELKRPCKINFPLKSKWVQGQLLPVDPNEQLLTYLEQTPLQQELQAIINSRMADAVKAPPNMSLLAKMMSDSRGLTISPYMTRNLGIGEPKDYKDFCKSSPKIMYAIGCIKSVKQFHDKRKEPISGQVIYSDRGVQYFPLIKKYLLKEVGFKSRVKYKSKFVDEVMIISGSTGDDEKEFIKEAFLDNVVKVVIGSSTIREGINLQKHGTAIYSLYVDWNPTDVRQLEGRIWRQKNKYGFVRIAYPLVANSMDVFVFQKLEEKTARINDVFDRRDRRNIIDLDSFNPEEIKYALVDDIDLLVTLDYEKEEKEAKAKLDFLADDVEKIKRVIVVKDRIEENLKYATSTLQEQIEGLKKYITWFDNVNQTDPDRLDKEEKEKLKRAQSYLERFTNIVNNKDMVGLAGVSTYIERWRDMVGSWSSYSLNTWQTRSIDTYQEAFKELREITRTVIKANGYNEDQDFNVIAQELEAKYQAQKTEYYELYEKGARKDEIKQDIIETKERLQVKGTDVKTRVDQFASTNYLLSYKSTDVDVSTCTMPAKELPVKKASKPITAPVTVTTNNLELELELEAIATATLLELELAMMESEPVMAGVEYKPAPIVLNVLAGVKPTDAKDFLPEIKVRLNKSTSKRLPKNTAFTNSSDMYDLIQGLWPMGTKKLQERVMVVYFNRSLKPIGWHNHSIGHRHSAIVDPAQLIGIALKINASGMVIAHNHPSGGLTPSGADKAITRKLVEAAKYHDLHIYDHLIVTPNKGAYTSFSDEGIMPS